MGEENILQLVACLPGMCKALGSQQHRSWMKVCMPVTPGLRRYRQEGLMFKVILRHGKFKASLGSMRSFLKNQKASKHHYYQQQTRWWTDWQVLRSWHVIWDGWSISSYTQDGIYSWENCRGAERGSKWGAVGWKWGRMSKHLEIPAHSHGPLAQNWQVPAYLQPLTEHGGAGGMASWSKHCQEGSGFRGICSLWFQSTKPSLGYRKIKICS